MTLILIISLILTFLDQIIKAIVSSKIILTENIEIIPNFFSITHVHNYGAAWSILSNKGFLLILVAVIALIVIYFFLIKNKTLKKIDIVLISMLIAGIIGNMIDRIRFGYVIDYLDFYIFGYDYPVFNLADILIVISIIILMIKTLKEEKNAKVQSNGK